MKGILKDFGWTGRALSSPLFCVSNCLPVTCCRKPREWRMGETRTRTPGGPFCFTYYTVGTASSERMFVPIVSTSIHVQRICCIAQHSPHSIVPQTVEFFCMLGLHSSRLWSCQEADPANKTKYGLAGSATFSQLSRIFDSPKPFLEHTSSNGIRQHSGAVVWIPARANRKKNSLSSHTQHTHIISSAGFRGFSHSFVRDRISTQVHLETRSRGGSY